MASFRVRTFRGRIFLAILAVVLIPAGLTVAAGVFTLRSIGEGSGTLGAWETVAESGRDLLESLDSVDIADAAALAAAERHRDALSASVRLSRLYAFVADRFLDFLPVAALVVGILLATLALLTAGWLSKGFAEPVAELVDWTGRIAREEPLPEEPSEQGRSVEEIEALRAALRRMATDLEEGRRQAAEAVRMRSWAQLSRRVAHEIKNPLTPMRMAAATLGRGQSGAEAEAAAVLLEEIERLDGMARAFAQFGRLPEGPRSEIDVGELLESLAAQHSSGDLPVSVANGSGVRMEAQLDALERALRNLILNAIEAVDGPGRIELAASCTDGVVRIVVADDGPGIPEGLEDDIWRPDVTTKRHGTGLGLSIVRQTIHAFGGTVNAENRPDGGAAFTLLIPQFPEPEQSWTS